MEPSQAWESGGFQSKQVNLQTFFKGNSLRYFTVADNCSEPQSQDDNNALAEADPSLLKSLPFPNTNETSIEWLLTKQFFDYSYNSLLPVIGTQESWRSQMLRVCAGASFLRYAVLSVTANHIAFEHPESRRLYGSEANRYRYLAIKTLSACVPKVEPESFFAVFNFSRLITLCCLARMQLSEIEGCELLESKSMLPEWVRVQHHGRALTWPHRGQGRIVDAMHGPAKRLYIVELMPESDFIRNPNDDVLQRLASAFQLLPDGYVDGFCLEALHMLRRIWAIPFRDNVTGFRDAALMWTARVPMNYLELVERQDPIALIIFAHFCVLWSCSEARYWYMKGQAEKTLHRILQRLDWQWQDWITWPVSTVLGICY